MKKKKVGRPATGETKLRMLFSIDEGVAKEFKRHCKANKSNMSGLIQEFMHSYNVKFANE